MSKHIVWYSASDDGSRYSCKTDWELLAYVCDIPGLEETDRSRYHEYIAEDCADDYHSNHDGYESSWPLKITLYAAENGPALSTFEVEREYEPLFSARATQP